MKSTTKKTPSFTYEDFEKGLMLAGYLTPNTEQEIQEIEVLLDYEKEQSKLRAEIYFKRAVLAAEIVNNLHTESTFGRVKFQKLVYLCEHAGKMKLQKKYAKFAAGPFDNKFMHSINLEFKKQKWFTTSIQKNNGISKVIYKPGPNLNGYKKYYEGYFGDNNDSIQRIISIFKNSKTFKVELVATIYFCLHEMKESNQLFSENTLLGKFYSWAEEKKRFSKDQILEAYSRMIELDMVPK